MTIFKFLKKGIVFGLAIFAAGTIAKMLYLKVERKKDNTEKTELEEEMYE